MPKIIQNIGLNYESEVILPVFRSASADVTAKFLAKDMVLQYPKSLFSQIFATFLPRIDYMYNQLVSSPSLNHYVPEAVEIMREKWNSDWTQQLAVVEKVGVLSEAQLEQLENVLDCIIAGDEINVILK